MCSRMSHAGYVDSGIDKACFGKSPFAFGPSPGSTVTTNGPTTPNGFLGGSGDNNGCIAAYPGNPVAFQYGQGTDWLPHHHQHQYPLAGGEGGGNNMRGGASPARDSPAHSNRNSAASSDSGRGYSTGGGHVLDSKLSHNYVNMHMSNNNINNSSGHPHHYYQQLQHQKLAGTNAGSLGPQQHQQQQQHRLSGQSYESGVSSRQSYHSSGSSSVGSLDLLEEQAGYSSSATINVGQLVQAGVADTEVLHAWLNDLEFGEYYPLFLQAGYDMPTISRMTPEDLTAIGITKPAHRKRLKSEIARLNIHDGIPEFRPSDLMEWLHLLGLGAYLDTLCGQGYDSLDYVTDITWEDLEEIGIKKLGHQKKIMLAIDRLKRLKSSGKRISAMDGRTASLELLEPPPPAPPISGRWSGGEGMGIPPHVYDVSGGMVGGARPKKSPSGDSISTTSSGNSGSGSSGAGSGTHHYHGAEMRVIPLPREDAGGGPGMAGGIPHRHNSTGSASGLQPDVVAIQVKRNLRGSVSEDKRGPANSQGGGYFQQHQYNQHQQQQQQLMYHSFQGPVRRTSESDVFADHPQIRSFEAEDRRRPSMPAEFDSEKHEAELNTEGHKKLFLAPKTNKAGFGNGMNQSSLKVETGEHIYDTPQISPSQKSPRPAVMPKPSVSFAPNPTLAGPLHVNTAPDVSQPQSKPSPVGKGGKKVPPPPPIRTDSIRGESMSRDGVPPGSPSRCLNNSGQVPASTVSVSASVHPPHSSSTSTSVSVPPKVAAKPTPPPVMQKPQIHHPSVTSKIQQQQQTMGSQQQQQQQQQLSSQAHHPVTPAHPVTSVGTAAKPGQQHSRPEPAVLIKPKVSSGPSSPYSQQAVKSPLPSKAPFGAGSASPASSQSHFSHAQSKNQSLPSAAPTVSAPSDAHSQVLSSCMKSLSEKIAGRAAQQEEKEKDDEDQFPDNVSTDSDDFPPPPPPIAMDIITPKIHNYGIPSTRKPGEFGLHHRQPGLIGSPRMMGGPGVAPRVGTVGLGTTVSYAEVHHRPDAATSRTAPLQTSSMSAAFRVQPAGHMSSPQALHTKLSSAQPMALGPMSSSTTSTVASSRVIAASASHHLPSNNHTSRPQVQHKESFPDPAHPMSTENRSDSTSSFESTSSSSSLDSNTLPFANENVGTIKQRAAAITTTAADTTTTTTTTATLTTNCSLPSVSVIGQALAARGQENESHRHMPGSFPPPPPSSSSSSSASSSFPHHQRQLSGGGVRPPVPSKKPTLSPKPVRLQAEKSGVTSNLSQAVATPNITTTASHTKAVQKQLWPEQEGSTTTQHSSNVLSDIDDMLQGLTDELDAALEEEFAS
ncbi:caskin-1 [Elysia marginata]|uniref:Caskin-1 n=1 Tax=Elysia marginata TaxID=1093978 RepID=A0AAV4EC90_9GAST|nr:caskin-1 [Elysia marginata]